MVGVAHVRAGNDERGVIIDALLKPLLAMAQWVLDKLPEGQALALPDLAPVMTPLAKVNSVIPIGPVMTVAIALLLALVVFIVIRVILVIINIVWW